MTGGRAPGCTDASLRAAPTATPPDVGRLDPLVRRCRHRPPGRATICSMAEAPLKIERVENLTVLSITTGTLLDDSAIGLLGKEFIRVVTDKGRCRLVVDISLVKLMSSAALRALLKLREQVERARGRVVFCSVRPALMKSFEIVGIDTLFEFFADRAQAVKSFS